MYIITTMYQFFCFDDYQAVQPKLLEFCQTHEIKGTFLLAEEGINGTVAGKRTAIDALYQYLQATLGLSALAYKESCADTVPFYRTKVKLKKEIVTMGQAAIKPIERSGIKVSPKDWHTIAEDPKVLLLDPRNDYETHIGSFKHAVPTWTKNFRQFPDYVAKQLDPKRDKKIAMFCTGGIRCEKASAYLLQQGFETVYQLHGGILRYLAEVAPADSLWEGECFVFDNRVAVNHQLAQGQYVQCFACRRPLAPAELESSDYQPGVACPYCVDEKTPTQRESFKERQRQIKLAKARKQQHIGARVSA